jgi:hypothetical protein
MIIIMSVSHVIASAVVACLLGLGRHVVVHCVHNATDNNSAVLVQLQKSSAHPICRHWHAWLSQNPQNRSGVYI